MAKGAEKCSPCMLSRHVNDLNFCLTSKLKDWTPSFASILRFPKWTTCLDNIHGEHFSAPLAIFLQKQIYSKKFKSFKDWWMEMPKNKISKTKETAEWNCSVCKIDAHLYAAIVCDGWNHLWIFWHGQIVSDQVQVRCHKYIFSRSNLQKYWYFLTLYSIYLTK
jgi:hypothetical protein